MARFISPVSEPYCGACNRMRLTADGKFHLCPLSDDELDVKLKAVTLEATGHRLDEGVSTGPARCSRSAGRSP
jgi:cyclic pyranopterin phosphate synthase